MGKMPRVDVGGLVYHVMNRSNGGAAIFEKPGDYDAFEQVVGQACVRLPMRILTWCVMPNHWHFILWPRADGDLSDFLHWMTLTHTRRWHAHRDSDGQGHLYKGRYKSIVVQEDEHLLTVCRYVERNPVRAGLVRRAEDWRWGAAWQRLHPGSADDAPRPPLCDWPVQQPPDWRDWVNRPQTQRELENLRVCIGRGRPFGGSAWQDRQAERFGLRATLRSRGRPRIAI